MKKNKRIKQLEKQLKEANNAACYNADLAGRYYENWQNVLTILGKETDRLENEAAKWKLHAETQEFLFEIAMQYYNEADTEIEKLKNDISSLHNELDAKQIVSSIIIDDLKGQLQKAWKSADFWLMAWIENK